MWAPLYSRQLRPQRLNSSSDRLIDQDTCHVAFRVSSLSGPQKKGICFRCATFGVVGPYIHKGNLTEVVSKAPRAPLTVGAQWGHNTIWRSGREREITPKSHHALSRWPAHDDRQQCLLWNWHPLMSRREDLRGPLLKNQRDLFGDTMLGSCCV